jgi:serine/threonine protein kinase
VSRRSDKDLPLAETVAPSSSAEAFAAGSTIAASGDAPRPPASDDHQLEIGATIDERYVVDRVIGRGGMGTVYLARDNSLGRDVALKLHRTGSGHERLYREAVAMAQLAHPNVVTVYEVGTVGDQLFVAMEYIRGATLKTWVAGKTWSEILDLLLDVGEGLAEAHRAGLVHRDFKPENVLVGTDGRPRVSDFGLARASIEVSASLPPSVTPRSSGDHAPDHVTSPSTGSGSITRTGAILGTPAYMSPEQFAGDAVDARSDQFSFCLAAWESLFGKRPFAGSTAPQLQQAIERGTIVLPEASPVPTDVRKALIRGLAPRPDARWPDMPTLLAALRTAARPRSRRWRAAGVLVVLAITGGSTWFLVRDEAAACGDAGSEVDHLVPLKLRDQIVQLARTTGDDAGRRVANDLISYARRYRETAALACRAVARRDWSVDLDQRSKACREQQARIATEALRSIPSDSQSARRALTTTAALDELADLTVCQDPTSLAAMPKPPATHRDELAQARAELLEARRQAGSGMRDKAQATIDRIAASPLGSAHELVATLTLARAAIARANEDFKSAISQATDAYYKAHADADLVTEILAIRDLLYWIGVGQQDNAAVETWYRLALSEVNRFEKMSAIAATKLRNAIVGVAMTRNESAVALEQARLATEAVAKGPPLAKATALHEYANVLATSGDPKHAIPIYEQAGKLFEEALGADHPQLASVYSDEALTHSDAGDYDRAVTVGERALAVIAKQPTKTIETANVVLNVAAVLINANRGERADELLLDARASFEKALGPTNPTLATIDSNRSLIKSDAGNYAEAAALLRGAIAIQEKSLGIDHPEVAVSLFNLAAALKSANELPAALEAATRCVTIRATSLPKSDAYLFSLAMKASLENLLGKHEDALRDASIALEAAAPRANFQAVAWPKLERGRALVALRRDLGSARRLLDEARKLYSDNKMEQRVTEIDALLAKIH